MVTQISKQLLYCYEKVNKKNQGASVAPLVALWASEH